MRFTLEYWNSGDWYVERLKGIPGVFSQGATLEELEANIRDAYELMSADDDELPLGAQTKLVEIEA